MEVEVNLLGVLLAAVSAMVIGAIWYARGVFGEQWMKLAKIDEKRMQTDAPLAMGVMFVLALIMAYVLAHVTYLSDQFFVENSYLMNALTTSFWLWLGFSLYSVLGVGLFEQRRKKLILLNLGNSLVTFLAMGAIIGYIGL